MPAGSSASRGQHSALFPPPRLTKMGLTRAVVTLASQHGHYGYRRITALLRAGGWRAGKDRVQRIWRRERLKVPKMQRPKGPPVAQRRFEHPAPTGAPETRRDL
jgi:hypothetical protein